jgi:hypothetical protein
MTMFRPECRKLGIEVVFFGHVNLGLVSIGENEQVAISGKLHHDAMLSAKPRRVLQF